MALLALALLGVAAPAAAADPLVLAHRGGSLERGADRHAENTLPAFRAAARRGFVLELDVHVTSDGVPVVIHDDTLDRTAADDCAHRGVAISRLTLEQMRSCQPVPTLEQVLAIAERRGSTVVPEIKNNPPLEGVPSDFDPTPAFATAVATALRDGGVPQERIIVQSFWPANLDVAREILPRAQTLFLTLGALNDPGPTIASTAGYDWVGPQAPITAAFVERAHGLGLKVAPYTVNAVGGFRDAVSAGADAIFTDDPLLAQDTLTLAPTRVRGRAPRRFKRVAVFRRSAGRCDFVRRDGSLAPPRPCKRPVYLTKSRRWRRALPAELPRGRYRARFFGNR